MKASWRFAAANAIKGDLIRSGAFVPAHICENQSPVMTQSLSVGGRVLLAMPVLHQLFAKVAKHLARARGTVRKRAGGLGVVEIVERGDACPTGGRATQFRYLLPHTKNAADESDEQDIEI